MTPRSEEDLEKIRSESREKIAGAALELFAKKGYASTTIDAIAKKAGVAKGLIYNYFTNKEELLYFIFLNCFGDYEEAFNQLYEVKDPVQLVELIIDGMFDVFVNHIDLWRFQIGIFMNPEVPERVREAVLAKLTEYGDFIKKLFIQCGVADAESEAWICCASLDGIMLYNLFMGDRIPVNECRNVLKKKYRTLIEQSCGKGGK